MGLAASQARFLAITARKMNCEFQSMQIAQQKLSVTRDLQDAAKNYQNALDATVLVWDADGRCDGNGDIYDLSYDLMMTPSVLNEYNPYLITDVNGRILLTDSVFQAAVKSGIIDSAGNPTSKNESGAYTAGSFVIDKSGNIDVDNTYENLANNHSNASRNAFLFALTTTNQIDRSTLEEILAIGEKGYTKSGIGGEILDKSISKALTTNAFINYMQNTTYKDVLNESGTNATSLPTGAKSTDKIYGIKLSEILGTVTVSDKTRSHMLNNPSNLEGKNFSVQDSDFIITLGEKVLSESTIDDLTIGDLLQGGYVFTFKSGDNKKAQEVYQIVLKAIAEKLGKGASSSEFRGLNIDDDSNTALEQAFEFTLLNASSTKKVSSGSTGDLYKSASKNNQLIVGTNNLYSFSITNMIKSFLTNFAIALDGFDAGYSIELKEDESAKKSDYVTDDPTYYFLLKKDEAITDRGMLNADFYNILYNQILMNGAISDSQKRQLYTQDKSLLQNAIKNGQMFISTLNNDGYYYQGAYTSSGHVAEIPDEDAIARAEVEYNVQKYKLNTKEESLELQMKNLDMEISSLTTEIDSVKNMISKNVEKVFTMFSN